MGNTDFGYATASYVSGSRQTISIFSDRSDAADVWRKDAELAGLHVSRIEELEALGDATFLSSDGIILADCFTASGAGLAALAQLDMHVSQSAAQFLVATSPDALDAVFGCLSQSKPEILVNPSHGERIIGLGRVIAGRSKAQVRDLSAEDRLQLLELTKQVAELAERLEWLGQKGRSADGSAFRLESPATQYKSADDAQAGLVNKPKPSLPDPRLVRKILEKRRTRSDFFDAGLFGDPAWDMLLDLTAARAEHKRVSVTSLCIASGVPPTTALRWITQMTEARLFERQEDDNDKRRVFIALTDHAADLMARYFAKANINDSAV